MAQNPFYVQPLGGFDIGRGFQGLQQNIEAKQERDRIEQEQIAQQERQNMAQSEMMRVLDSGSPREMAGFLSQYPEMGDVFKQAYGFTAPQTEGIVKDFGARILATEDPEKAKTALSEMIMAYRDAGITAPTNTVAALQELEAGEEGALDRIKMITMALNPDLREGYMEAQKGLGFEGLDVKTIKDINSDVTRITKAPVEINKAYNSLSSLKDNASPTDQLAAVFKFMKALDPTSSVRESEQGQVYDAQGAAKGLAAKLNQFIGQGGITSENFDQIVGTAYKLSKSDADDARADLSKYLDTYGDKIKQGQREKFEARVPSVKAIPAPPAAIEYLKNNPETIDQFEAMYEYRPEGF